MSIEKCINVRDFVVKYANCRIRRIVANSTFNFIGTVIGYSNSEQLVFLKNVTTISGKEYHFTQSFSVFAQPYNVITICPIYPEEPILAMYYPAVGLELFDRTFEKECTYIKELMVKNNVTISKCVVRK